MRFDVITLFPEMVQSVAEHGVTRRAKEKGLIEINCINPRDYTKDIHRMVDDRPYGGGPGMVMKADVLLPAIRDVKQRLAELSIESRVIYLSPQGKTLDQVLIKSALGVVADEDDCSQDHQQKGLILLCGRYEGIDERVIDLEIDEEWSMGDYVLSGGELGAMVIIDAMTRLLPGALGHRQSAEQDSFSQGGEGISGGLLDCPHYTRPEVVEGYEIPAVLKSGNHAEIAKWRRKQALGRTFERRSELINRNELSEQDRTLLNEFLRQQ